MIRIAPLLNAVLGIFLVAAAPGAAQAADVTVMISGGFSAALRELAPAYEHQTGNTIVVVSGPSGWITPQAIPNRLQRGESADVVVMVGSALDGLIAQGKVTAASRVDLARSRIAMAVRDGAPVPDISSVAAFTQTVLAAKSIAYSDSASGVYPLDRVVSEARHRRSDQEQEEHDDSGGAGRCGRRAR